MKGLSLPLKQGCWREREFGFVICDLIYMKWLSTHQFNIDEEKKTIGAPSNSWLYVFFQLEIWDWLKIIFLENWQCPTIV